MRVIRASEIGEYVYCARSWWLRRVVGWEPSGAERRAEGVRRHMRHGRMVALSSWLLLIAGVLFGLGVLVALITS
jgi:CRISPR/Cas system-associated exonuclease Cas4 (RecB family)